MKYLSVLTLLLFLALGAAEARAADDHQMSGHQPAGKSTQEYMKAMDDMHGPMMDGVMDPDPDAAFVKGMIPHHRGAVAMAEIELKYGQDPELRKLAQDIIEAQAREIEFMENWLKKKQGR